MSGKLYLVPTPIGNLGDLSRRVTETLEQVDFIAAEDTRVTMKLLYYLDLKKNMVSYHRHSAETVGQTIIMRLLAGETCALVTDAGTPAISDPGEELVRLCAAHDIPVEALPGPCALVTALSVSGLSTARFVFEGFLPTNKKNRQSRLEALRHEERTIILYEAPHKLCPTLEDLSVVLGSERKIALCRELTKLHEEVRRTTLGNAQAWYQQNAPRGEFVLIVEGAEPVVRESNPEAALERVASLRADGLPLKAACRQAGEEFGISKNSLYSMVLERENKNPI